MKGIFCLPLFFASRLWGNGAQHRVAIDLVVAALNDPFRRAGLFAKDADSDVDFDHLVDLHKNHSPTARIV
jgi:hypothetical protein